MAMDSSNLAAEKETRFKVDISGVTGIHITPTDKILRAADRQRYIEAQKAVGWIQHIADKTLEQAKEEYRQEAAKGYQEGYRNGLQKGRSQAAEEGAQAALERAEALQQLERELATIIMHVISTVLGEIDASERIGRLVGNCLSQLRDRHGCITIHLHPSQVVLIEAWLPRWKADLPYLTFQIVQDKSISADACRVAFGGGIIEGCLETQLAAIGAALARAVETRTQNV